MIIKSLKDIVKYLEIFQKSGYLLSLESRSDAKDLPSFQNCHVHKFWELKFRSPEHSDDMYQITLIPPGTVHCMTRREFSADIMPHAINITAQDKNSIWKIYSCEENNHGDNLIPELLNAVKRCSARTGFTRLRQELISVVLDNFLLLIRENLSNAENSRYRRNMSEIAVDYMENCYHQADLSIEDIAGFVGVSPQYLNSIMRKSTGKTIRQNLISIRLNHARELLASSQYFVKEVAELTGWRSPFYFSNSYRRHFGIAPSAEQTECESFLES